VLSDGWLGGDVPVLGGSLGGVEVLPSASATRGERLPQTNMEEAMATRRRRHR
jgi:hypothetical protein